MRTEWKDHVVAAASFTAGFVWGALFILAVRSLR